MCIHSIRCMRDGRLKNGWNTCCVDWPLRASKPIVFFGSPHAGGVLIHVITNWLSINSSEHATVLFPSNDVGRLSRKAAVFSYFIPGWTHPGYCTLTILLPSVCGIWCVQLYDWSWCELHITMQKHHVWLSFVSHVIPPNDKWRQKQTAWSSASKPAGVAVKFGIPQWLDCIWLCLSFAVTFPKELIQPPQDRWHNIMELHTPL